MGSIQVVECLFQTSGMGLRWGSHWQSWMVRCSMRYCSVGTIERCLFPFSVWGSGAGLSHSARASVVCDAQSQVKNCGWGWREQRERECYWAKKVSLEQIVKWGSLRKLNLEAKLKTRNASVRDRVAQQEAGWISLDSFHRCGGRWQWRIPGARVFHFWLKLMRMS